jgi:hypothetical protein
MAIENKYGHMKVKGKKKKNKLDTWRSNKKREK